MTTLGKLERIIPLREIPYPPYASGPQVMHWMSSDSEANFTQAGGHPLYGCADIQYCLNSRGYRCPEFTADAQIRVASFGCSIAFGLGLKQQQIFHEIVCRSIAERCHRQVVNWNLGVCATSNDAIAQLVERSLAAVKPQLVLVSFTHPARRQTAIANGRCIDFVPTTIDARAHPLTGHLRALSSGYDDLLNFYRNYVLIQSALQNLPWLFSTCPGPAEYILDYVNRDRYVGAMTKVDTARDHSHPGPQSHRRLAERYLEKLDPLLSAPPFAS